MKLFDVILLVVFLSILAYVFWISYRNWKIETDTFLKKIDCYKDELLQNRHRVINNARLNGFPVGNVIFIMNIDGINVFYHFNSYQFLPDFLPNEELMADVREATQTFLEFKEAPKSFSEAIELVSDYYNHFPDSEAHLYKDDFFNKVPYLLPF